MCADTKGLVFECRIDFKDGTPTMSPLSTHSMDSRSTFWVSFGLPKTALWTEQGGWKTCETCRSCRKFQAEMGYVRPFWRVINSWKPEIRNDSGVQKVKLAKDDDCVEKGKKKSTSFQMYPPLRAKSPISNEMMNAGKVLTSHQSGIKESRKTRY